ncbi:MAG: 2OG-Fe(II) oxygenase, partial [Saprospiraceae bacterium]
MHVIFDTLIDSFIENKIGIAQHFLSESLALHLTENLVFLYRDNQLKSAGTGEHTVLKINNLSRGDKIHWLDRKNNNIHENTFFDLMDDFVLYLNTNCYTGIKSYEFHYTLYEKGSFYIKHLDQFRHNDSRK